VTVARSRRTLVLVLLALPAAAAVLGALLATGHHDRSSPPARPSPPARELAVGHIRVAVPSGWTSTTRPRPVPGLDAGATSLRRGGAQLTVAEVPPSHPSLLPLALARQIAPDRLRPVVERHGALRTWRYAAVLGDVPGQRLDLFVAPTTAGTATLACRAPATAPEACRTALTGLRLAGASALPLGADAALREQLPAAVRALNRRRGPERAALARARSAQAAGRAAERLSAAYLGAVRTLAPLAPPGAQGAALLAPFGRLGFDYGALAKALRAHDDAAVRRTGRAIASAEAALPDTLRRADAG
jgi:hypothetical protein